MHEYRWAFNTCMGKHTYDVRPQNDYLRNKPSSLAWVSARPPMGHTHGKHPPNMSLACPDIFQTFTQRKLQYKHTHIHAHTHTHSIPALTMRMACSTTGRQSSCGRLSMWYIASFSSRSRWLPSPSPNGSSITARALAYGCNK